jgi:uncharacterized phage-associated protein
VPSVFDFAAQIQARLGSVDAFRLNKLVYYVQAWSLAWRDRPAFHERIEAWRHGPVAKDLWVDITHQAARQLNNASRLSADDLELVERVLIQYGHMSSDALIKLTHAEEPWKKARGSLSPQAPSSEEIPVAAMRDFYTRAWREAQEDNEQIEAPPAFSGTVEEFEKFLGI